MLAAEGIRIRALLDLVLLEAIGFKSGAARGAGLIDHAPERGDEHLPAAMENHGCLRQGDSAVVA